MDRPQTEHHYLANNRYIKLNRTDQQLLTNFAQVLQPTLSWLIKLTNQFQ